MKNTITYNIRGWTTGISAPGFKQTLLFGNYEVRDGSPMYNGNIPNMEWTGADSVKHCYMFYYDSNNRITDAYYEGSDWNEPEDKRYSLYIDGYDKNGNITAMRRYGRKDDGTFGLVDDLTITYDGNQPVNATDHAEPVNTEGSTDFKDGNEGYFQDYTFNGVGALTSDRNKNITLIEYDNLNHPRKILVESDVKTGFFPTPQTRVFAPPPTDSTVYTFTPDGEKTRVVHYVIQSRPFVSTDPGKPAWPTITTFVKDTTDYIGPFVICNGRLDKVLFNGGYVTFGNTNPAEQTYHYFSTDHQGNVRAVFNESGAIEQSIAYDPFGVVIPDLSTGMGVQPYLYNGKELDRVHGLDWYDYGARMYDVTLGRWTSVDPLCEKYYHISPYAYCGNNPVNRIDLFGMDTLSVNNLNKDTWSTFNTETDIIKLNELVCHNTSFSINNMFNGIVDFAGNSATTWGGLRYTERPWGDGFFRTSKGKFHSFDDLKVQRNGKYKQGIQGIRYAKSYAYNASKPFIRIGNIIGYYQFTDSFYSFIKNPSFLNSLNLAVDLASFAYWEIGSLYYGIKLHMYSISRNRNDIKEMNETHGLPPWFGQYNPTLGNYEYSPFIY